MSNLYCIYDKKTSAYLAPTVHVNDAEAMRMLDNAIKNNQAGLIAQYPDDYSLYCIASFNPSISDNDHLLIPTVPHIFVSEVSSLPVFATTRSNENPN